MTPSGHSGQSVYRGTIDDWHMVGSGSFGRVYRVERADGGPCDAIKVVSADDASAIEAVVQEVSILRVLHSPHIVAYRDCFPDPSGKSICVAMEYCGLGSVEVLCGRIEGPEIAVCARAALCGLAYLHRERVLHRDVKAANLLLTEQGQVKLGDFGVSRACVRSMRTTFVGTPYWMAPELIMDKPYDGRADVWSLGITVIELAEGRPPHYNGPAMLALQKIARGPPPQLPEDSRWSTELRDFVRRCCVKDIGQRPTSDVLLADGGGLPPPDAGDGEMLLAAFARARGAEQKEQQQQQDEAAKGQAGTTGTAYTSDQGTFIVHRSSSGDDLSDRTLIIKSFADLASILCDDAPDWGSVLGGKVSARCQGSPATAAAADPAGEGSPMSAASGSPSSATRRRGPRPCTRVDPLSMTLPHRCSDEAATAQWGSPTAARLEPLRRSSAAKTTTVGTTVSASSTYSASGMDWLPLPAPRRGSIPRGASTSPSSSAERSGLCKTVPT
eukprot:TRINITY_DN16669_c0_g2_i1.p1 TRINITY_DN16669_c0_g2~~TRINITY_DN16669_c0_g2_i1.p1  ORF type:complete len:500 (+),score=41.63 TRINITY_DN16669_c0_g2_i1:136-1635(+)